VLFVGYPSVDFDHPDFSRGEAEAKDDRPQIHSLSLKEFRRQ
jgi:hypothetical protein